MAQSPKLRYTREVLLALAESPLVKAPEGLPPIDSYFTKPENKETEARTPRKDASATSGSEDGGRSVSSSSKPANIRTTERGMVFGPPKMNFSSSQQSPASSSPLEPTSRSTTSSRPPRTLTTPVSSEELSGGQRKNSTNTAGPSTSTTFPRAPKYSVDDRINARSAANSSTTSNSTKESTPVLSTRKEREKTTESNEERPARRQPQPLPPPSSHADGIAPRDLSVLKNKRSDEAAPRARMGDTRVDGRDGARRGPGGVNTNSSGNGDKSFIGTGGSSTNNNSALRRPREYGHDNQPEWFSESGKAASKPVTLSSEDISKPADQSPSGAPLSGRIPGVGPDGLDEIQRFKLQMKERERLERERAGLPPALPPTFKKPENILPPDETRPGPISATSANSTVDMMFGPSGNLFRQDNESSKADALGSPTDGSGDAASSATSRRPGDPRAVSRFNKFFESTNPPTPPPFPSNSSGTPPEVIPSTSISPATMGNDNNLDPQARMQLWRDSTKNDTVSPTGPPGDEKHQMSMDILAKIGVIPPGGPAEVPDRPGMAPRPPPPHLAGQGDFEPQSRRMLLEDEIMSQFMSKGQQASNGVSKEFGSGATNSMGGGGGRRLTEKEIIQTQILQSLSGGGAAPISNVTPLVAAPPGTRVMTEEEFLRMQRGGQPVSNTSPTTGGQTRQSPPSGAGNINPMGLPPQLQGMSGGRMYLEEDVHMGKNGPPMNGGLGRGMPPNFGMRGERDLQGMMPPGGMMGGGPPMGGNAEMSRVMAMLQRSTMGNSMDMQGGLPPQNHQRMNPMHPNMPFPPMGPGPMGMGGPAMVPPHLLNEAPRPGFMFPPHLQNLPPHLIGPMMGGPPGMPQPPGGSLYRNAVNANFGGSEDPVAALLQSSINAKKGGGVEPGMMFGGPPGPGMMGRPPMMDSPMGQPSFPQGPPGMQPFFPQQMMNPNQPGGPPMGYGMPNVGKPNNFY